MTLADGPWNPPPPGWWKSPEPTPRERGEDAWRLARETKPLADQPGVLHRLSCEVRDESGEGFGWEVVIREDDEVRFSRRCETEGLARYVANALKQDHLKGGWIDVSESGESRP